MNLDLPEFLTHRGDGGHEVVEVPSRTAGAQQGPHRSRSRISTRTGPLRPSREKDACGVGFIADMKNRKTHTIVEQGLRILENMDHRGAVGPTRRAATAAASWSRSRTASSPRNAPSSAFGCPRPASTASAICSCRATRGLSRSSRTSSSKAIAAEGLQLLGWRDVPVDSSDLGESIKAGEPLHRQIFVGKGKASRSRTPSSASCSSPAR